jgi:hypothetical protein
VPTAEASLSEMTDDAEDNAFDLKVVRWLNDDGLHGVIGRMEFYGASFAGIGLDRGFAIRQGDHGLPIPGGRLLLHHDYVT